MSAEEAVWAPRREAGDAGARINAVAAESTIGRTARAECRARSETECVMSMGARVAWLDVPFRGKDELARVLSLCDVAHKSAGYKRGSGESDLDSPRTISEFGLLSVSKPFLLL